MGYRAIASETCASRYVEVPLAAVRLVVLGLPVNPLFNNELQS